MLCQFQFIFAKPCAILTEYGFIKNHCCEEHEKHYSHIIWPMLEGCLKDILEMTQTEEILSFTIITSEIRVDFTILLVGGVSEMPSIATCLFHKYRDIDKVDYVQQEESPKNSIVTSYP